MQLSNELINAGFYARNVDVNGWIDLRGLAVSDEVRVASLDPSTIAKEDVLNDQGCPVELPTAILRCFERNQKAAKKRKIEQAAHALEVRAKAAELLGKIMAFNPLEWDLKPLRFSVESAVFDARHMCALDWDAGKNTTRVSGHVPSDISVAIKTELETLKTYRANVEAIARKMADAEITRRVRQLESVTANGVYVRVGRTFTKLSKVL